MRAGQPSWEPTALRAVLVLFGSMLGAFVSSELRFPNVGAAVLFLPYAVLTAMLLVERPQRYWLLLLASAAGNFVPHLRTGPWSFVLLTELANITRALLVVFAVRRFARPGASLDLRAMSVFLIAAVAVAPAIAAIIGALVVTSFREASFWLVVRAWFFSNALTGITLLPPLWMLALRPRFTLPPPRRLLEAAALGCGLVAVGGLVFLSSSSDDAALPASVYLPAPFLLWAAVRFSPRGVSAALLCVAALTIWGATGGRGPFTNDSPADNLLDLQLFLIVVATPFMLLSALIEERRRTTLELAASRSRRETELIAHREAERTLRETDRHKDEFLAILGHELRNPLAPISAALELLESKPGNPTADRARAVIGRQLEHLQRLVDDLLDVSRITRGDVRVEFRTIDAIEVAEQALETVRPLILSRAHELHVSLPRVPVSIRGDRARLAQVLINLLNNAAKYTDRGGRVTLALHVEAGSARFSVEDSGVGIAEDSLERIFRLFERCALGPGRTVDGLGIGLTLARRLVELHAGTLTASSAGLGHGSAFVVSLPLEAAETIVPVPAQSAADRATPLRILVVDDNVDAADTLTELLTSWGHEVRSAYSGRTALVVAEEHDPQVVLSDLGLPDLDGLELARALRRGFGPEDQLMVAVTGFGQVRDEASSLAAGFDHHLVKPIDFKALSRLLLARQRSGEIRASSPAALPVYVRVEP